MFQAVFFSILAFLLIVSGLVYGMIFGDGVVDKICSYLLGGLTIGLFFLAVQGIDWINDWQASRAAQKFNEQSLSDMRNQFRAMTAQSQSMNALMSAMGRGQQAPPQVGYQADMFEDFDEGPIPEI